MKIKTCCQETIQCSLENEIDLMEIKRFNSVYVKCSGCGDEIDFFLSVKVEKKEIKKQGQEILPDLHFVFECTEEERDELISKNKFSIEEFINQDRMVAHKEYKKQQEEELQQYEQEVKATRIRVKLRNDLEYDWEKEERKKSLKIIRYIQNRAKRSFNTQIQGFDRMLLRVKCSSLGINESFWIDSDNCYVLKGYAIIMDAENNRDICELLNKYSDDAFLIGWRKLERSGTWYYDIDSKDRTRK